MTNCLAGGWKEEGTACVASSGFTLGTDIARANKPTEEEKSNTSFARLTSHGACCFFGPDPHGGSARSDPPTIDVCTGCHCVGVRVG